MRIAVRTRALILALLALAWAPDGDAASAAVDLTASYEGQVTVAHSQETADVAGALQAFGSTVTGTLALGAMSMSASTIYTMQGRVRRRRVRLVGASTDGTRLVWLGKVTADGLRGRALLARPGMKVRGRMRLTRRTTDSSGGGGPPACDNSYFTDEVMPKVLVPVCQACHSATGQAAMTTFRVTPGDPLATQASVALHINVANPDASRILRKPLNLIPHGGGQRLVAGSPEEQILRHWVDLVVQGVCGGPPGGGPGSGSPEQQLYADNCASCHGDDARGLQGRPDIRCAVKIHDPVRLGKGTGPDAMPKFDNLTDADITTLAGYLAGLCDASGRTGVDLYTSNCSTCHGADARGVGDNPNVRCSSDVNDAVRSGKGSDMPAYSSAELSNADVASIEAYLAGLCTASGIDRPADLYESNCGSCHGTDARGVQGRPDVRCAVKIHDPVRLGQGTGPDAMPAFANLSDADIATLAGYLTGLCDASGRTGVDLYTSNCGACHAADGRGANGDPNVRCAVDIADAVRRGRNAGAMPAFTAIELSNADVTGVQTYLDGLCAASGPDRPADLYVSNCASCHGPTGGGGRDSSGVHGPEIQCQSAGDMSDAIRSGPDEMPSYPRFSAADITAVTDYLHGYCVGGGGGGD
ncbi:MAG TPA: c-type cytochrome [Candidatus Eisenbacteria bacterium]|nr:c-type cytochrome [Candidatus Eisenbacteria bacterium]